MSTNSQPQCDQYLHYTKEVYFFTLGSFLLIMLPACFRCCVVTALLIPETRSAASGRVRNTSTIEEGAILSTLASWFNMSDYSAVAPPVNLSQSSAFAAALQRARQVINYNNFKILEKKTVIFNGWYSVRCRVFAAYLTSIGAMSCILDFCSIFL
jgi:hypothetical protein